MVLTAFEYIPNQTRRYRGFPLETIMPFLYPRWEKRRYCLGMKRMHPMTDTAEQPQHGTLSDEQIERLLSDSRICGVFMKLIAEALQEENTAPEQSEKPIRD